MSDSSPSSEASSLPSQSRLILVMIGLCLAVFLTGMDQTILATAAPQIADDFKSLNDLGWWTDIYLLTLSSFQLFYGKLYSLCSIKLIYLLSIGTFELGSLICAVSPNSTSLIFGRAVAGFGAAGVFSGSVLITTKIIPLSRRAIYLGFMSGAFGLAAIIGPFIGGALTDRSTWRWCFGINLPIGAVTVLLSLFFVQIGADERLERLSMKEKVRQFDVPGTLLLLGCLVSLLLALQWGGSMYPWNDGRVIALFVLAGIFGVTFVTLQAVPDHWSRAKALPTSLTCDRDVWLAALYAMCITGGIHVAILYLPVWSQAIRGDDALSSGVSLTPLIVGYVVTSIVAGGLTSAIGYYNPAMIIGTALSVAGAALLTRLDTITPTSKIVGYQLLYGFGSGFGFGQPSYIVQTILPSIDVPIGVTFINMMQNLSASIFVAIAQAILQNKLSPLLEQHQSGSSSTALFNNIGVTTFLSSLPPQERASARALYSGAITETFYICLALACLSALSAATVRWRSMKRQPEEVREEEDGSASQASTRTNSRALGQEKE